MYLRTWPSIQEAELDLADLQVVTDLTHKVAPAKFDAGALLRDLKAHAERYAAVPRYSREMEECAAGQYGRVKWDLGGTFWRPLSEDIMRQMGLLPMPEKMGVFSVSDGVNEALSRFQHDVENASRDLQNRLRKTAKRYSFTVGEPPEIQNALKSLAIEIPISEVTVKLVKKKFNALVTTSHPDFGGNTDDFIEIKQARDMVMRYLEAAGRE